MRTPTLRQRPARWTLSLAGVVVGALVVGLVLPEVIEPSERTTVSQSGVPADVDGRAGAASNVTERAAAGDPASDADATASASGSEAATPAGDARAADPEAGATRTASDVGVTATTVKIGILLLDLAGASAVGFGAPGLDVESQRESWRVVIDEVNEHGGINGRTIEPVYETFDPATPDTLRSACLSLTEDGKVFAVLEGTGGASSDPSAVQCYTVEHKTPYLTYNHEYSPDLMRKSVGFLYGLKMSAVRAMANAVGEFERVLAGVKVGIVETAGPGRAEAVDRGLVDPLRDLGASVAHRATISEDLSAGSSQVPVEVQQMRAAGAEVVFLIANGLHMTQFVQAADAQGYHPQYIGTDVFGGASDFTAMNMPPSFDGALGTSSEVPNQARAPRPETPVETACRELFERRTGRQPDARTSNQYGILMRVCGNVDLFTNAAIAAGPSLTRRGLGAAIENRTTRFEVPLAGAAAFRPGKPDGGDFIMTLRWSAGCRCWTQIRDFHPGRFG